MTIKNPTRGSLVLMSEIQCYIKLYGKKVYFVPHYQDRLHGISVVREILRIQKEINAMYNQGR